MLDSSIITTPVRLQYEHWSAHLLTLDTIVELAKYGRFWDYEANAGTYDHPGKEDFRHVISSSNFIDMTLFGRVGERSEGIRSPTTDAITEIANYGENVY